MTKSYSVFEVSKGKRKFVMATSERNIAIDGMNRHRLDDFFGEDNWFRSRKKEFPVKGTIAAWYSITREDKCILVMESSRSGANHLIMAAIGIDPPLLED